MQNDMAPEGPRIGRTLVAKIIDAHRVHEEGGRTLVYVDRLIMADTALATLRKARDTGSAIRRPEQALLIPDHYTASARTTPIDAAGEDRRCLILETETIARAQGVDVIGMGDPRRGIQHVVSTEQAFAQPGVTIVAVDSHTSTQGAVGALAFSIGSDLPHVLATQCTWIKPPRMMRITLDGALAAGVTVKDVALALIARLGTNGAAGHAVEFAGSFVRDLSLEGRMTLCNMTAEMGGLMGIVAPDEKTFAYLRGRPFAPSERHWPAALAFWQTLRSDDDARFDREEAIDVARIAPMVTWGNSVDTAIPITGSIPDPAQEPDAERRAQMMTSRDYMGLQPAMRMETIPIDQVFIGSCNNGRIEDLRAAAERLHDRTVRVPTLVVPGSTMVRAQAEAEGLDRIFLAAGARWGEAGCSMCVSMNGDTVAPGARCASTSNRNHMGRQGRGSRTHLVSPPMAAAAAVAGHLVDVRAQGGAR